MSAKLDKDAIARNVRRWRHDRAKAAVRVEVRHCRSVGEDMAWNRNDKELELLTAHQEAAQFRNGVTL